MNSKRDAILMFVTCPGIGDFIKTIPIIRLIIERYPEAKIVSVARTDSRYKELFRLTPELGEIIFIDPGRGNLLNKIKPSYFLGLTRAFLRTCKLKPFAAIQFKYKRTYTYWAILAGIPRRGKPMKGWESTHADASDVPHIYHHYFKAAKPLDIPFPDKPFTDYQYIPLPDDVRKIGRDYIEKNFDTKAKTILICPGGTIPKLWWGYDNFLKLAQDLADNGMNVILATGPYEKTLYRERHEELTRKPNIKWEMNMSLLDLTGILKSCDLLVGGATGLTHVADAIGIPVLAIFAQDDIVWQPIGGQSLTICKTRPDGWVDDKKNDVDGYVKQVPYELVYKMAISMLNDGIEWDKYPDKRINC